MLEECTMLLNTRYKIESLDRAKGKIDELVRLGIRFEPFLKPKLILPSLEAFFEPILRMR